MSLPRAPATLPDDFAAALGHAVAAFGFLEEALKRGIYALSRDSLGDEPGEAELDAWVTRMEQIAGDSLGTLIDSFIAACERGGALPLVPRRELAATLRAVRDRRNMLCHASWRAVEGGGWRPGFVSSRGSEVPERMVAADLEAIRAETLEVARAVVEVARDTGHDRWTPEEGQREAERERAQARTAQAQARTRRSWHPAPAEPEDEEDGPWHPLEAEDREPRHRPRRRLPPDPRRPRRDPEEGA